MQHSISHNRFSISLNFDQPKPSTTNLFPEFELVLEAEESIEPVNETEEQSESRRMKEYEELMKSGTVNDMPDLTEGDLMPYAQNVEDEAFGKFKKRIARNNDQVLRYNRGGEPLWISSKNTLSNQQVPLCEQCQSRRVFEFQVKFCHEEISRNAILTIIHLSDNAANAESFERH